MSSNRQNWPRKFATALGDVAHVETWQYAYDTIHEWLLESLEPNQRMVYHFIRIQFHDKPVTTADVAYAYSFQPNHAATILKNLYDLNLLSRQMVRTGWTRRYEYRLVQQ